MNDKQLKSFLILAKCGSFSKAEHQLFITKQALKKQIDSLEAELNIQLFTRSVKGMKLTQSGEIFIEEAESILKAIENAKNRLYSIQDNKENLIIEVPNQPRLLLEKVIHQFTLKYPNIKPTLRIHSKIPAVERIKNGQVDLVEVVKKENIELPASIAYQPLVKLPYLCLVSKDHLLAKKKVIHLDDLQHQTIHVNSFNWKEALLNELKDIPDINFKEHPYEEEIEAFYNACYSKEIYISAAYYIKFLEPLVAIPLDIQLTNELGLLYNPDCSKKTKLFLKTAKEVFSNYDYLQDE